MSLLTFSQVFLISQYILLFALVPVSIYFFVKECYLLVIGIAISNLDRAKLTQRPVGA